MKNMYVSILAATSLCCSIESNAFEKGKFYVSGMYGVGIADKFDYNDGDLAIRRPIKANVFGLAAGYQFNDNIRAELGYTGFYGLKYDYKFTSPNGNGNEAKVTIIQKQSADVYFFNTYYDINKFGNIKPYVTAGVGLSINKSGDMNINTQIFDQNGPIEDEDNGAETKKSAKKKQFAWNIGVGVNYTISDKIDLNLINYKYSNLGNSQTQVDEDGDVKNKLRIHSISTGITFKF